MNDVPRKMTEAEVATFVRDFERRTGIFTHRVNGVALWQLIRFEVSVRLQELVLTRSTLSRRRLVEGILRGLLQSGWLAPAAYLCKSFDSAYRRKTASGFEDVYFDDLKPVIPGMLKTSSCDAAGYEERLRQAVSPPAFDDTSIVALSALLGRLLPVVIRHPAFKVLSEFITEDLGFHDYTPARLRRVYNVFWWRTMLYRLLLRRVRPNVVLCPDSGQFGLMNAAKLQNLPYVEMQHGVFTSAHPNALPPDLSEDEANGLLMPSAFAVYGKHSVDLLRNSWLGRNNRIHPVGAPFLEAARAVRAAQFVPGPTPRVTLSTQGIARDELGNFIAEFLRVCSHQFELIVKLHPAYDPDRDFYEAFSRNDPRVVIEPGASTNSTHACIAISDFHMSISSTCHYDALGIGTPTGVLALETHESVSDLLGVAGVTLIRTPAQLARLVEERSFGHVPDEVSQYFFETDFARRIKELLSSLES